MRTRFLIDQSGIMPPREIIIECNLYLGVDPGASGGLAILDLDGNVVDVTPMPDTPKDISDYFKEFGPRIKFAIIENVHAFPGSKKPCPACGARGSQGVVSTWKFGWNKGLLDMALVDIPHESIQPGTWQKAFSLIRTVKEESGTDKKNRHKRRAQELFPSTKITHAIADSLLLAEFCRRKAKGLL